MHNLSLLSYEVNPLFNVPHAPTVATSTDQRVLIPRVPTSFPTNPSTLSNLHCKRGYITKCISGKWLYTLAALVFTNQLQSTIQVLAYSDIVLMHYKVMLIQMQYIHLVIHLNKNLIKVSYTRISLKI